MTSEGARVRSPWKQYRRHRGKIAGSCENVRCRAFSRRFCSTHCRLLWNGRRLLRTPAAVTRRPWFIHSTPEVLRWWHESRKLNLLGRSLYKFFSSYVVRRIHTAERLCKTLFSPCTPYIHTYTHTNIHTYTIHSQRNAGSSLSHHKFTVLTRELGRYYSVQHGFEQGRGRSFSYERVLSQKCSLIVGAEVRLSRKLTNQKRHFIDFSRLLPDVLFCFIWTFPRIKRLSLCQICSKGVTPAAASPFDPWIWSLCVVWLRSL